MRRRPPAWLARLYSRLPWVERRIAVELALRLETVKRSRTCGATFMVQRLLWLERPWWSTAAVERAIAERRQVRRALTADGA